MAVGRGSDFGIIEVPLDANESTFFLAPQLQESPVRSPPVFDSALGGDLEPVDEEQEPIEDEDADDIDMEETEVNITSAMSAPAKARFKKPGKKTSRYGIEYPALPVGVVKRLAQTFAQTSGASKAKIAPDTLSAIMQASDWFFGQLGDDLQAYAKHAGRKTIDESDMITLMKRLVLPSPYSWVSVFFYMYSTVLTRPQTTSDQHVHDAVLTRTAASATGAATGATHDTACAGQEAQDSATRRECHLRPGHIPRPIQSELTSFCSYELAELCHSVAFLPPGRTLLMSLDRENT